MALPWRQQSRQQDREFRRISIRQIRKNPNQPRKVFDPQALQSLAESIRQYGVITPLTVREIPEGYELVSGERRLRAASMAGLTAVPCYIVSVSDQESALMALLENLQRKDLDCFEEALFLRRPHFSDMDNTLRAAQPRKELKLKATLDYPMGLPLAVRQLMADHPEVYRVWLVAAHSEGETVDHKLFIVDFDGKPESIFPKLAEAVRLYMRQGESFEMMKADIRLLRVAEQAARPIYEKA